MRKKAQTKKMTVKVGRFDEPTHTIEINEETTVQDVLESADITVGSAETIWVNGEAAELDDVVDADDVLTLVGKKVGGNIQ